MLTLKFSYNCLTGMIVYILTYCAEIIRYLIDNPHLKLCKPILRLKKQTLNMAFWESKKEIQFHLSVKNTLSNIS